MTLGYTCFVKYLVTGGLGFIGSHLVERLIGDGHSIIVLDNLSSGSTKNLGKFLNSPLLEIVEGSVNHPFDFAVDGIFNLACPASPIQYQRSPIETTKTSFLGALHCLELASKLGIPVLQASTSEVYGDPRVSPQHEDYWGNVNPIGIRSCYDEGKRVAESLFFDFSRIHNTQIRVARIFNTYGPQMMSNDGRVVSNFIMQAINNEPLTIYGDGSQIRSFCYVTDTVEGIYSLFNSNFAESPINIGNPQPITIEQLASEIIELSSSQSRISYKPLPMDDPVTREPNISKITEILDWKPQTGELGLRKILVVHSYVLIGPEPTKSMRNIPKCLSR